MATVLIVEDEMSMAELIKERLEDKGYKTVIAYTGGKGLEVVNTHSPDVMTLDIHLPDMDGIEVLKMLKKDEDRNKAIPIIIVTSDDTKEEECKEYKADGFVRKPINFKKLEEIINSVIKKT
ncbi:MAG: response regulator [Elusimicrobiota bacterium]